MIFMGWLYAFLMLGRFQVDGVNPVSYTSPVIFAVIFITLEALYLKNTGADEKKLKSCLIKTSAGALAVTGYMELMLYVFSVSPSMIILSGRNSCVPLFFGMAGLLGLFIYLTAKKKWTAERFTIFLFGAAFVFHIFYYLFAALLYQHDVGQLLGDGEGHFGYIEYLHDNLWLPQFDPRERWQFYHPPLNHILQAVFLKIQTLLGIGKRMAAYNATYLPLLYFMFTLLIFYKISLELGLKKKYANIVVAVCACSPAFFNIGNYINNDMLSVMFMMLSIYLALKWYKDRRMSNILKIAVSFGAGMLSKLSTWMAAVPVAIIFIAALIEELRKKDKKAFGQKLGQMFAFLGVAAPLSLFWSVRNYIRWGVPLTYIPVGMDRSKAIKEGVLQRLFDFSPSQLKPPWEAMIKIGDPYNEYNPLIGLIKTSCTTVSAPPYINYPVLAITTLLCIVSFICMIAVIIRSKSMKGLHKAILGAFYAVIMVSYYIFCFKYPDTCTEEIRYASQVIFIGAFFTAWVMQRLESKEKLRKLQKPLYGLIASYCILAVIMEVEFGLTFAFYYYFN